MHHFKINLQLFTGEKTERATPKRRKEAREKGQVLQSREINSAFVLLSAFLALKFLGNYIYHTLSVFTRNTFVDVIYSNNLFTVNGTHKLFLSMIYVTAKVVLPILGTTLIVGLLCSYMQVGFLFTTKSLKIDFNRMNPLNGLKKIFSKKSLVECIKSVIKIGVVGYVAFRYLGKQTENILNVLDMEVPQIVLFLSKTVLNVVFRTALVLIILAVLDYFYQYWEYENELKMSKQEVKEEYKQTEGDPRVKSKIKEKQRQISMRRMMQDVPKADVIITNPIHYAVAIRYDSGLEDAPIVLAKGKDLIAQKIKDVALAHQIPIIENKTLARTIYFSVDIGEYIPPELYQAVAEVLAYVYKMKNMI